MMSKSLRAAVASVLAALACLLGTLTAAAPAHAAEACRIYPTSLKAKNLLNDSGGQDWIWLRVGNKWWPSYWTSASFEDEETKYISGFSVPFTGTIETEVVYDYTGPNYSIQTKTVSGGDCRTETFEVTRNYYDGDAEYVMTAVVGPN